jgi:hypothetical protein
VIDSGGTEAALTKLNAMNGQYDVIIVNDSIFSTGLHGHEFVEYVQTVLRVDAFIIGLASVGDWMSREDLVEAGCHMLWDIPIPSSGVISEMLTRIVYGGDGWRVGGMDGAMGSGKENGTESGKGSGTGVDWASSGRIAACPGTGWVVPSAADLLTPLTPLTSLTPLASFPEDDLSDSVRGENAQFAR